MAAQINTEELEGCRSYYRWILDQIRPAEDVLGDTVPEPLCRLMFETDFVFTVKEDEIRVHDAEEIRKEYASSVGKELEKSERDIDRIWKSVHGKCSVLELIFSMCLRLDNMVNEGDKGEMVPSFFRILVRNIGLKIGADSGSDVCSDAENGDWKEKIDRFMNRGYREDGSGGGLFPIKKWSKQAMKDQREVPIWYQMNYWLNENLDDDEHFMMEKFDSPEEKLGH